MVSFDDGGASQSVLNQAAEEVKVGFNVSWLVIRKPKKNGRQQK